jgi:hypothetical protein
MMAECSVIPEGANIRYHLISTEWFNAWKAYTNNTSS